MNVNELEREIDLILKQAKNIRLAKGSDYAGDIDRLSNFRIFGSYGILIRMHDKICRLIQLTKKGGKGKVKDESVEDTAVDLLNYTLLYLIMKKEERNQK